MAPAVAAPAPAPASAPAQAAPVNGLLQLQRTAGNRAVVALLGASSPPVIRRSIGCREPTPGVAQFQIDTTRPAWVGAAAAMGLTATQDRCHVIAFEVIQNDLCTILNSMLAVRGTGGFAGASAQLTAMTDALFVTAGAERTAMVTARTALAAAVDVLATPAGAPAMAALTLSSGALLSLLNSCADNLRPGDSSLNASIGFSIDADFAGGTVWYSGPVNSGAAPPAGVAVTPPLATVLPASAAAGNHVTVGFVRCLQLTAPHAAKVFNYQQSSNLSLSFVVSGGAGAVHANAVDGQHLSSTTLPTDVSGAPAPPYPVLVPDPAGAAAPWFYG